MKKRSIRSLSVSEIGMGCMGFSHGYGEIPSEAYSIEAIRKAYDYGCTFYDTAEAYSPNLSGIGHNELILGKALKDVREHVVLATKITLKTDEVAAHGLDSVITSHLKASLEPIMRTCTTFIGSTPTSPSKTSPEPWAASSQKASYANGGCRRSPSKR